MLRGMPSAPLPSLVGPAEMSTMIALSNGLTRPLDKMALMGIAV